MNGNSILTALGQIDAEMVMEAAEAPKYRAASWKRFGALAGVPRGLNAEEMAKRVYDAAEKLDLALVEIEEVKSALDYDSSVARVRGYTANGIAVEVSADGLLTVDFEAFRNGEQLSDGLALPQEYRFLGSGMSSEEAEAVTAYLTERFAALLGFERPQTAISSDCAFSGERTFHCAAYDGAGDHVEQLLNYAFARVSFAPDEEGKLMLLRVKNELDLAEKLGDYPILSLAEATEKLARGEYLTSVPCGFPSVEHIARAELVYCGGRLAQTLLPFYRFYVELPDGETSEGARALGLKTYGAYYVPARQGRFIATISYNDTVIGGND